MATSTAGNKGVTGAIGHPSGEAACRNSDMNDEKMDNAGAVGHPGQISQKGRYPPAELEWENVGSGTFAKTFIKATRMRATSKGGPPLQDVDNIIRGAGTGKIIDECIVDGALARW